MQPGLEPGTVRNITISLPLQKKNSPDRSPISSVWNWCMLAGHNLEVSDPPGVIAAWQFSSDLYFSSELSCDRAADLTPVLHSHSYRLFPDRSIATHSLFRPFFSFFVIISRIKNRDFPSETQANHKEEIKKIESDLKKCFLDCLHFRLTGFRASVADIQDLNI